MYEKRVILFHLRRAFVVLVKNLNNFTSLSFTKYLFMSSLHTFALICLLLLKYSHYLIVPFFLSFVLNLFFEENNGMEYGTWEHYSVKKEIKTLKSEQYMKTKWIGVFERGQSDCWGLSDGKNCGSATLDQTISSNTGQCLV